MYLHSYGILPGDELGVLLSRYVERNSGVVNLGWDPNVTERLLIDPFARSRDGRVRVAHFFLLMASINESELVGRAENSRTLMVHVHGALGEDLFHERDSRKIR